MCGIVGYIGFRQAYPILVSGLKRLEYRGYDSAGISLLSEELKTYKKAGKVNDLEIETEGKDISGNIGIGHTRWATHGVPNDTNSHPHLSSSGKLSLIHNGIIENYALIKEILINKGYTFNSDTDSEVVVQLVEDIKNSTSFGLCEAVRLALNELTGTYAIIIISEDDPGLVIAARRGSPLVIGMGEQEYFIASDVSPIIPFTKDVIYLDDNQIACITADGLEIKNQDNEVCEGYIEELELKLEMLDKGDYSDYMLKEIFEQPKSIRDCLRGRISGVDGTIKLGGIKQYDESLKTVNKIIIIACGTSWHSGLVGKYLLEALIGIAVEVEYASEFRYRNPVVSRDDIIIAISQSGETADTLAAIELAKSKGATVFGITNVSGSSISRITDAGIHTHAGPEIGVASTKAFTAQVTVLLLFTLYIAQLRKSITPLRLMKYIEDLEQLPAMVETVLQSSNAISGIAYEFMRCTNCLFLGRGNLFPVALEGALKLKEISYIHAEGYPAAEMKHGPIALVDKDMPVVFLAINDACYSKIISNIQEIKAREGKIVAIVSEGDTTVKAMSEFTMEIPVCDEAFNPILATIPLQLFAYHVAKLKGLNVDQPRNLAKSVTVE